MALEYFCQMKAELGSQTLWLAAYPIAERLDYKNRLVLHAFHFLRAHDYPIPNIVSNSLVAV